MKKGILFDLDNTLYDYDKVHKIALNDVYSVFSKDIKITKTRFLELYNLAKTEIHRELSGTASSHNRVLYFQRLIEKTHQTVHPQLILKLYNSYWNSILKNMTLRSGTENLLKHLKKKGLKIAIVSDLTTNIQLRKLEKLKIEKYIDVLITSEEAGNEKPHPIMFLLALNKLNLTAKDVFMVGDHSINDIEGANALGIESILLKKGIMAKEYSEDYRAPNHTITKLLEIVRIIDNN